ncbi:MAG: DUF4340 domain-containing protein [Gemmatimonadetes bacterium]|nr:DUF4340 domain-containing protein [Gemmatimonadota bacterium]MYH54242.1 DUF4340 domain-containing protein [Gemmatimonadota bacterium]MYK66446.1 DUF4340 domain-containing protein [Gemmatimonadota bacterium]
MNDLKAHIALFVVAVVATLLTWTRETVDDEDRSLSVVWDRDTADVLGLHYRTPALDLQVSRRSDDAGTFLWGVQTRGGEEPMEFPVGANGQHLLATQVAVLRVQRDLGQLSPERRTQYGLDASERRLSVRFSDGPRELVVGDSVFGSADRYAMEPATGIGYVLSRHLLAPLDAGDGAVRERTAHHFAESDVAAVRISGPGGERRMARTESGDWTPIDGGAPDAGFGNFMERVALLSPAEGYDNLPPPQSLTLLLRVDYIDAGADYLGFVELLHDGGVSPRSYYLRSEATRILGRVPWILGERVEQVVEDVF